jgi:hypothetical protein
MIGRGTRIEDGIGNLHEAASTVKPDCVIVDIADNTYRLRRGLATVPSLFGLPARIDLGGQSVTAVARKLEGVREKYPHIDITELADIHKLDLYVQQMSLFDAQLRPEVSEYSRFFWTPTPGGGFAISLSKPVQAGQISGTFHLSPNLLEKWDVGLFDPLTRTTRMLAQQETLREAFAAADTIIRTERQDLVSMLYQTASWRAGKPSDKQVRLLESLARQGRIPANDYTKLSKGQASALIGACLNQRYTR